MARHRLHVRIVDPPDIPQLAVLIDRGHRELPIEANFIGKKITTKDNEVVEVKLTEIDGEDAIYVMEKI